MAYSTKADILNNCSESELAQLSSEEGEIIDNLVVNKAITDADAEIDSYLGVRYSVPLASTPAMVNKLSSQIALYNLYSRRASISMNETVKMNYDNAIDFLRQVANGKVSIGVDPPPSASTAASVGKFKSNDRVFTNETMKGW